MSTFDGEPYDKGSGDHQEFRYDAWRVIAMVASDLEWFGKDEAGTWPVEFANKYLQFFYDEGIDSYGSLYTLDGTCTSTTHSAGLVAMVSRFKCCPPPPSHPGGPPPTYLLSHPDQPTPTPTFTNLKTVATPTNPYCSHHLRMRSAHWRALSRSHMSSWTSFGISQSRPVRAATTTECCTCGRCSLSAAISRHTSRCDFLCTDVGPKGAPSGAQAHPPSCERTVACSCAKARQMDTWRGLQGRWA